MESSKAEVESGAVSDSEDTNDRREDAVPIKRSLNLTGAMAVIIGAVIGSGIYISPKGVIENTGSVGMKLLLTAAVLAIPRPSCHCLPSLVVVTLFLSLLACQ